MKKALSILLLGYCMAMTAEPNDSIKKDSVDKNKPVFTVIKENPITPIKNQSRSGTCWDYSTLAFFESEITSVRDKK